MEHSVCHVWLSSGPPEYFTFSYCTWLWNVNHTRLLFMLFGVQYKIHQAEDSRVVWTCMYLGNLHQNRPWRGLLLESVHWWPRSRWHDQMQVQLNFRYYSGVSFPNKLSLYKGKRPKQDLVIVHFYCDPCNKLLHLQKNVCVTHNKCCNTKTVLSHWPSLPSLLTQ